MTVRLPTRFIVIPVEAIFRPDPLPPELQETWFILRGISWVNEYRYTPPVSIDELLSLHQRKLTKQALLTRLERLEADEWISVERQPGRKNIYRTVVPAVNISENAASWAERPSLNRDSGEDSTRMTESNNAEDTQPTSQVDLTSPIVIVVGTEKSNSSNKNPVPKTTTNNTAPRTLTAAQDTLKAAGIIEPTLWEFADVPDENAESIAAWISDQTERQPNSNWQAIAITRLRSDHLWTPPKKLGRKRFGDYVREFQREREARASDSAASADSDNAETSDAGVETNRDIVSESNGAPHPTQPQAAQIWNATLLELQLQMTKATFDSWIKPTFALSFDAETSELVIAVRNAYARQWLENRLLGMIDRTLNHVIGKPTKIIFETRSR